MAGVREQDQYMPIANVIRIMRRILPVHAKISDDAKETIQECVSEYISFITSEANEKCQGEQRKTVTAEDVLWAMEKLGFDNYLPSLHRYLHRYRDSEGEPASVRRASACVSAMGMMHPPPLAPQHQRSLAPPPLPPLPAYSPFGGMFDFDTTSQGFYRDEHHASASGSGGGYVAATFDPYANNINRE